MMKRISAAAFGLCAAITCANAQSPRAPQLGPPARDIATCKFAAVDPSHRFIVAGVMDGDTLTNLQFGDPNSRSTIVRVQVEPYSGPLTLYLHSQNSVVWDFQGAIENVRRAIFVARNSSRRPGVRGLPKDVIDFPDLTGCPSVVLPPSIKSSQQQDNNIELYFGRSPDRTDFQGKPNSLELPEGKFGLTSKKPRGLAIVRKDENGKNVSSVIDIDSSGKMFERPIADSQTDAEGDLVMYHPGGFREIDEKSVLAAAPVLTPETYPGEAGLIQLERLGAIRHPRRSEIDSFVEGFSQPYRAKFGADYRKNVSVDYVVTRDIMLPPALFGAHLKNFLVLSGVPAPRGNPGHGCLMSMDGYRANGANCPGPGR